MYARYLEVLPSVIPHFLVRSIRAKKKKKKKWSNFESNFMHFLSIMRITIVDDSYEKKERITWSERQLCKCNVSVSSFWFIYLLLKL